jgi:hypothetical protein
MRALVCYVTTLRQRALALFHRTAPLNSEAADRRERWNQAIAEHKKPLESRKESER